MELENHTRYPAALYRGCIDEERIAASLVVRRTFDLIAGHLVPASEEVWPVSGGPWESPQGPMPGDDLFYRGGVDVFVFGSARPPRGRPAPKVDVTVRLGDEFTYTVAVVGDRTWMKRGSDLVPSDPKPFTEIPLTMAHAFGGADEWDELPIPFPANPAGKGYAAFVDSVPGKPLPNIEDPSARIRKWDDRPDPVGVAAPPYPYAPRVPRTIEFDPESNMVKRIDPKFYNAAFPDMIAPRAVPGDRVTVTGITTGPPVEFELPPSDVRMRLFLGERVIEAEPAIDQVGIEADRQRVFVTYRHAFRYRVVFYQKRQCQLLALKAAGAVAAPPATALPGVGS